MTKEVDVGDVFDTFLSKDYLFLNKDVLASNYVPSAILHRGELLTKIAQTLAPSLRFNKPSNLFIYGNTGTGKTLSVLHTVSKLAEKAKMLNIDLHPIYLNCKLKKTADTEYRLVAQILREFGREVPATGLPTDELYHLFQISLEEKPKLVVLVLDEIDQLVKKCGDDILYTFTRLNADLKSSKMSLVGISNDVIFIGRLDPRVKSSLSEEELFFPSYNALQIQDILRERAAASFKQGAVEPGVIEKCAAFAAREHGDARRAIELLRVAGELAEREDARSVSLHHIDSAQEKIERERVVDIIAAQPKQTQATLYAIIALSRKRKEGVFTGEIYDVYKDMCSRLHMRPLTQRRVSDIIGELDMLGIIGARVTSKGRYGRTREISISISGDLLAQVSKAIEADFGFSPE